MNKTAMEGLFPENVHVENNIDVGGDHEVIDLNDGPTKFLAVFEGLSDHEIAFEDNPYEGDLGASGVNGGEGLGLVNAPEENVEEFVDPDYVLEADDEDLTEGLENAKTGRPTTKGRPKGTGDNVVISGVDPTMAFELDDNASEYEDSDELHSNSGSDSDFEGRPRFLEFNAERDMNDPQFQIGMLFDNPTQFRDACKNHGICNRFQLRFKKNTREKVDAICKGVVGETGKCPWRAYASKVDFKDDNNPTMQLKCGYFVHECSRVHSHSHLTSRWIAKKYLEDFRSDQDWKVQALIDRIQREMKLTIERMKGYRAKCYALEIINGDERSQYDKAYRYMAEILRSNPGSTVKGRWKEGRFVGMYVCLNALKSAFKAGCRKFISLDGCWLKGLYGGQLLSAVGIDPNDCIFPIAYAMVETESKETWLWFLELLADDLGIENSIEWTFMSDRQKGLIGRGYCKGKIK